MTQNREPQYHPITMLPVIAELVDGGLADGREIHASFLEAKDRPHVLDDAMVNRAIAYHEEALVYVPIQSEQFRRWLEQPLTPEQTAEIARLQREVSAAEKLHSDALVLLRELAKGTIDKIMVKSDEQLGLEAMLRLFGQDGRTTPG